MFGARIERNVDPKLLRGEGVFVDDIPLPNALHVAFARSPFARARIRSIDARAAKTRPGIVSIYTCEDIGDLDIEMPLLIPHPSMKYPQTQRPLARDQVYYVGQTVAMVVAVDRYAAEDAAALIEVDYEPLAVEIDLEKAVLDGAPLVHAEVPNNIAAHFIQVSGDPDDAFVRAEHVTKIRVQVDRSTAAPMECRAVAATWDAVSGELTVWDGTQAPISVRGGLASILELDEDKVRVIAPDVGGGFGQKVLLFYPDELLVPMAAMRLGRPVKYIEDRRENFVGSSQERTQIHYIELAALKSGEVIGLRDSFLHDTGAFIPYGIAVAQVASTSIAGPYRIPNIWVEFKAVYTPTVQVTPYRGADGHRLALRSSGRWTSWPRSSGSIASRSAGAISSASTNFRMRGRDCCLRMGSRSRSTADNISRRSAWRPPSLMQRISLPSRRRRAPQAGIWASAWRAMSRAPGSALMRADVSASIRSRARSM
jgi:CO/xanthine dehydrogenase Mo-binding subunit